MTDDPRLYAPAAARNRDPIRDVLRDVLPPSGLVLEVASGSGEHAVHLAAAFPHLTFQPSDPSETARRSIAAWIAASGLGNIRPPLDLDASVDMGRDDDLDTGIASGPVGAGVPARADAVLCINMIHISPWPATIGLMRRAAALLPAEAPLYLYGPYKRDGQHTAPSNAAFDANLRSQNADWGVRDLETVAEAAAVAGFTAPQVMGMPANNLSLIFRRRATSA
jgi:hypothetical protein